MSQKKRAQVNFIFVSIFFLVLALVTWKIFSFIYETHPTPYMDEIFHIPQAQLYCKNVWSEWNPKITTLPGLYLISYVILKPIEIFKENICTVHNLRFVNILGTLVNFLLTYLIMSKLHNFSAAKRISQKITNIISAINLAIFPPLYFFTFLYYTDVWSLTFVLSTYYGCIFRMSKFFIAISGMLAVLMRQTNIIWVGFTILIMSWDIIVKSKEYKKMKNQNFHKISKKEMKRLINQIRYNMEKWKSLVKEIFSATYPSLLVCLAFVLFVLVNGSVVVGDKKAHTAVLHPMQNMYFLDFIAFFAFPYYVLEIFSRRRLPNVYILIALTSVFAVLSEVNKLEHPYLLADNRHLAFYIWRRLFGNGIIRRVVVPTYAVSAVILWDLLRKNNLMFKLFLGICIAFNLTLQHLFELRYFIIPFVLCRLHFRQNKSALFEFIQFSVINFFAVYIFANKPFSWNSEPNSVQRFIW